MITWRQGSRYRIPVFLFLLFHKVLSSTVMVQHYELRHSHMTLDPSKEENDCDGSVEGGCGKSKKKNWQAFQEWLLQNDLVRIINLINW